MDTRNITHHLALTNLAHFQLELMALSMWPNVSAVSVARVFCDHCIVSIERIALGFSSPSSFVPCPANGHGTDAKLSSTLPEISLLLAFSKKSAFQCLASSAPIRSQTCLICCLLQEFFAVVVWNISYARWGYFSFDIHICIFMNKVNCGVLCCALHYINDMQIFI